MFAGTAPSLPTQRVHAPGSPHSVVVRESYDVIDTFHNVRIEGAWPIGPSWYVGCVNGDFQQLEDLSWRSPTELVLTVDTGEGKQGVVVSVDDLTGRVTSGTPDVLGFC